MTEPPLTDDVRTQARAQAGGWVYALDPAFEGSADVPPEGVVGAWPVDGDGEVREPFQHNPNYRPSAQALELPAPRDALEDALQRVVTGRLPEDALVQQILDSDLVIFDGGDGSIFVARTEPEPVVSAFTSQERADEGADWPSWQRIRGADLVGLMPDDCVLHLNPGIRPSARIPVADLKSARSA